MKLREWNESYAIGIDIIDKQHQELIHLANHLQKATSDVSFEETLEQLVLYVERHFVTEQEFLRLYKYPQYLEHVKIHNNFAKKVYEIYDDIKNNKMIILNVLTQFIENWITNHILIEDKKFSEWIKDHSIDLN